MFSWSRGSNVLALLPYFYAKICIPFSIVAHPESFSSKTYLDGLRADARFGSSVLYSLFREPVVRRLAEQGFDEATAAYSFRLAVSDMGRMALDDVAVDAPVEALLLQLSTAHADGLTSRSSATSASEPLVEEEVLRSTRQKAVVWSAIARLDADCRQHLLAEPRHAQGPCFEALQESLRSSDVPADALTAALSDAEGFSLWQYTEEQERIWQKSSPAELPSEGSPRSLWRWAVFALIGVVAAYAAYHIFFRPKTLAELYAGNFKPPRSLMADWEQRHYGEKIAVTPPTEDCLLFLQKADVFYQAGDYARAIDPLLLVVLDTASTCHSDAWLYLGLIHLHLKDPISAIQCLTKIEDLERFGEDIYWYQVMAYLQIAQSSPHQRERIAKAIELAIPNLHSPKRRAQAEVLLENLSR